MYENTEAIVLSPDGHTDPFKIKAGVLQGDTLAPFLFIIVLDYIMRKSTTEAERLGFTLNQSVTLVFLVFCCACVTHLGIVYKPTFAFVWSRPKSF